LSNLGCNEFTLREGPLLCATSVSLWLMNSKQKHTTETQRTQRLHREINM